MRDHPTKAGWFFFSQKPRLHFSSAKLGRGLTFYIKLLKPPSTILALGGFVFRVPRGVNEACTPSGITKRVRRERLRPSTNIFQKMLVLGLTHAPLCIYPALNFASRFDLESGKRSNLNPKQNLVLAYTGL